MGSQHEREITEQLRGEPEVGALAMFVSTIDRASLVGFLLTGPRHWTQGPFSVA
jgi:hypothetical protein